MQWSAKEREKEKEQQAKRLKASQEGDKDDISE
jgi:hypothetical protein